MLAAGSVILTVVFADQTLATVLEATRIRTAIGPSQAWYTENLRYYYLILPTVDGSLSRRFGFLITALCLFTAVFIMLRRKRVRGVARGPAWRLMGVIFGTMFFLMFTPTKWVHHFGLFAAVGAAMAALTTVLVSPAVLRWSRNRMAFLAAVLFLLALCFATTNGWWYVSSYGVPFNAAMPQIGGIRCQHNLFRIVRVDSPVRSLAALRFPRPRRRTTGARADRGTGADRRRIHGSGVRCLDGDRHRSPVPHLLQRLVQHSGLRRRLRAGRRRPRRARHQRRFHGCPARQLGTARSPLGGVDPVGFSPNGVPAHTVAEAIVMHPNQPGTDYDWDAPTKLKTPGINGSTVPLPYGLDPQRVPVAGSYSTGAQQQSKLTSAWYQLPNRTTGTRWSWSPRRARSPATACCTTTPTARPSCWNTARPVRAVTVLPAGRLVPDDLYGEQPKAWRNLRYPRSRIPADAVAVRVVAEDLSLTPEDWIAVTPPRVPELRSVQEYVGSTQPVLMDWAVGLAFPCQQPMLHSNGVTDIPKFRITPDYTAKKMDTDTWEDGVNGGLLGITDLLLRAHVMATYLSRDWARDWGSLRRFDTLVDAPPADLDLGTATHFGWWSPGQIRIKP